jgi:hypothetical protein
MQAKIPIAASPALAAAIAFAAPARSADLPQSGTFTTRTVGKTDEQVQAGDKQLTTRAAFV